MDAAHESTNNKLEMLPIALKTFTNQSQLPTCLKTTIVMYSMSREANCKRLSRPLFQLATKKSSSLSNIREDARNEKFVVEIIEFVPPLLIIFERIGCARFSPFSSKLWDMPACLLIWSAHCSLLSASRCKPSVACERVKCGVTAVTWHPVSCSSEFCRSFEVIFLPLFEQLCL